MTWLEKGLCSCAVFNIFLCRCTTCTCEQSIPYHGNCQSDSRKAVVYATVLHVACVAILHLLKVCER